MASRANTGSIPVPPPTWTAPLIEAAPVEAVLAAAGACDARALLEETTRAVTALLGERGSCILFDPWPRVLLALHAPALIDWPIDLGRYPEVTEAARKREPIVVDDVRSDARLAAVRDRLPRELGSVRAIPLVVGERCAGVILVQSSRPRVADSGAVRTAALVARIAALAIDRGPAATGAGPRRAPLPAPDRGPAGRVLLVEDDRAQAAVLVETLQDEGYLMQHCPDGAGGLERALASLPDLILLDVNLPGMTGFELAARVRDTPECRHIPIIFLSATDGLPARVRALDIDEVDFIPKPFSLDELLTRMERSLSQATAGAKLRLEAERDELTGLANLRLLRARLDSERARTQRYGSPLSLVMVDLDKLKRINEAHGHLVGSEVLRAVAGALRSAVRETDLVARYGGDEFVVLLPHTSLAEAVAFAERARDQVAALVPGGIPVTISLGVSMFRDGEAGDDLLRRADAAAFRAKRLGGNSVAAEGVGAGEE